MLSRCAANFGEYSASSLSSASLVLVLVRLPNAIAARVSSWPERSIARMVLSKVGALRLSAMAWISRACSAMPRSKAGAKSVSLTLSNCGYW